ncbi:AlkZ-related protein [Synergistes jonesii]|uniref:AlkZ-related protein n=1 Tax=Synergistes jonesii TaxID=2754 RepID=UPI0033307734
MRVKNIGEIGNVVTSPERLAELVEAAGFLPLLRSGIPGFSVEEHTPPRLWFTDGLPGPWEWKGPVIRQVRCAYGRLFGGGRAGFVSGEWYPELANYRRGGYDFDARYEEGLAKRRDREIFELLEGHGSLLSKELKRLGNFRKGGNRGFETAMTRMQMQCYVTIIDFEYQLDNSGNPYGWGVARFALPEKYFGGSFTERVYSRGPEQSKEKILAHLRGLLPDVEEGEIIKAAG